MERKLQTLKLTDEQYFVNLLPMKNFINYWKICNTDSSTAYLPLQKIFIPYHFFTGIATELWLKKRIFNNNNKN